jgi:tetratricopeptide (TPR) repeat protein
MQGSGLAGDLPVAPTEQARLIILRGAAFRFSALPETGLIKSRRIILVNTRPKFPTIARTVFRPWASRGDRRVARGFVGWQNAAAISNDRRATGRSPLQLHMVAAWQKRKIDIDRRNTMITKLVLAILLAIPGVAAAQGKLADQLRKAIVEEEANQNLDKAIQAYKSILAQFDEERKTAAAAMFHLADCYRKQGNKEQAIATYQRVNREFADQAELAAASRNHLAQTYRTESVPSGASPEQIVQMRLLTDLIMLVEKQIQAAEKKVEVGLMSRDGAEFTALRKELIELKLRMEDMRQGIIRPQTKK